MLGIDKLVEVTAQGIGAIAGPMLAVWKAEKEGNARIAKAKKDREVRKIEAETHALGSEIQATSPKPGDVGALEGGGHITNAQIVDSLLYQQKKRLENTRAVFDLVAGSLGDGLVDDQMPDPAWVSRFFGCVQDVSSEHMQKLWSLVLKGEVKSSGRTSLRTLSILRNMDQTTAETFAHFCSMCVFLEEDGSITDGRVLYISGSEEPERLPNTLQQFGLPYEALLRLNEHGLIIPNFVTFLNYAPCIVRNRRDTPQALMQFQGRNYVLLAAGGSTPPKSFTDTGVALTRSGLELASVVEIDEAPSYETHLTQHFAVNEMVLVDTVRKS